VLGAVLAENVGELSVANIPPRERLAPNRVPHERVQLTRKGPQPAARNDWRQNWFVLTREIPLAINSRVD